MIERRPWLVLLALVAGLAWIAGIGLVSTQADTDPVGAQYDAFNRVLTPALALLLASALAIRDRVARARATGIGALTAVVVGLALSLVGNALEFWGVLASSAETAATAERLGLEDEFWGSLPGFLVFLAGGLTLLISLVVLAVKMGRWAGSSRGHRIAVGAGGILMIAGPALWAVSLAAALVASVLFAFAWLTLATVVDGLQPREETASSAAAVARST